MYITVCIGLVVFFLIGFVGGWYYGEVKTKIAGYLRNGWSFFIFGIIEAG